MLVAAGAAEWRKPHEAVIEGVVCLHEKVLQAALVATNFLDLWQLVDVPAEEGDQERCPISKARPNLKGVACSWSAVKGTLLPLVS